MSPLSKSSSFCVNLLVYLAEAFGHYGLLIIMLPVTLGFLWEIKHFERLERGLDVRGKEENSLQTLIVT